MPKNYVEIRILIFAFVLFVLLLFFNSFEPSLYQIEQCNAIDGHNRLTCYKKFLESELRNGNEVNDLMKRWSPHVRYDSTMEVNPEDQNPLITNCHAFMHAAGDIVAERHADNPEMALSFCNNECFSACTESVVSRMSYLYGYEDSKINQIVDICLNKSLSHCIDGAGHAYFNKYVFDIIKLHDALEEETYPRFNNWDVGNLSLAFEACEKYGTRCYLSLAHSIYIYFHFNDHNWTKGIEWCNKLDNHKQQCLELFVFTLGAGEATPQLIKGNANEAISFCTEWIESLGETIGRQCYKGIGAFIMMFVDSLNKDSPLLKKEMAYLASLCKEVGKYSDDCYSGIKLKLGTYKEFGKYLPE